MVVGMSSVRNNLAAAVLSAAIVVAGAACGQDVGGDGAAGASGGSATRATPEEIEDFCAAIEALDQTDGTTEAAIVLDAVEDVRRTAPAEIRKAVSVTSDTFVINNYPSAADPSMAKASPEELSSSAARLRAFVDEHCELRRPAGGR
jgi:hypothetical protein